MQINTTPYTTIQCYHKTVLLSAKDLLVYEVLLHKNIVLTGTFNVHTMTRDRCTCLNCYIYYNMR
jgi:hypothetical protein